MASEKQIEANRRNAQLSTGPRTEEGKAVAARNAFKHGMRSQAYYKDYEDMEAYHRLVADLMAEYQPQTVTEEVYVERMALCLHKLNWVEDEQNQSRGIEVDYPSMKFWCDHEARLERAFDRALDRLRMLQKERLARQSAAPSAPQPQPAAEPTPTPAPSPRPSPPKPPRVSISVPDLLSIPPVTPPAPIRPAS